MAGSLDAPLLMTAPTTAVGERPASGPIVMLVQRFRRAWRTAMPIRLSTPSVRRATARLSLRAPGRCQPNLLPRTNVLSAASLPGKARVRPGNAAPTGASVASLLLLPLSLSQPLAASAQSARFALTCVGTETGYTIPFTYRWGNSGQWRSASVEPGRWVKLMWNYDYAGENRSPQLRIRYDDNTTRAVNIVNTPLNSYAASSSNCEDQGKTYNFYQRNNELYVQEED